MKINRLRGIGLILAAFATALGAVAGCANRATQGPRPAFIPIPVESFFCDFVVAEDLFSSIPRWPLSGIARFADMSDGLRDFGLSPITSSLERRLRDKSKLHVCGYRVSRSSEKAELELRVCEIGSRGDPRFRAVYSASLERGFEVRPQSGSCHPRLGEALRESFGETAATFEVRGDVVRWGRWAATSVPSEPLGPDWFHRLRAQLHAPDPRAPRDFKHKFPDGTIISAPHARGVRLLRIPFPGSNVNPTTDKGVDIEVRGFTFQMPEGAAPDRPLLDRLGARLGILVPIYGRADEELERGRSRIGTFSAGISADSRGGAGIDGGVTLWLGPERPRALESLLVSLDGKLAVRTVRRPDGAVWRQWLSRSTARADWTEDRTRRVYDLSYTSPRSSRE